MNIRKHDKYHRRILKHEKFPFAKLKANALGDSIQYSNEEKTLLVIAENMREISYILNYLNDSKLYIYSKPAPFIKNKIPNGRYLNYHMHNYFNNVYILKERMSAFMQRIKRSSKEIETKETASSFYATIEQFFDKYGEIRDKHTHLVRYIDNDIYNLETFESAYSSMLFNSKKIIKKIHISMAYSEVKNTWLDFMKKSNISINNLVSEYLYFITELILNKDGSFKVILKKYSYE
jgi:hypothetical protein